MVWVIIILVIEVLELGIYLAKHGKAKIVIYNFFIKLLTVAIELFLFYKAGLFNVFKIY